MTMESEVSPSILSDPQNGNRLTHLLLVRVNPTERYIDILTATIAKTQAFFCKVNYGITRSASIFFCFKNKNKNNWYSINSTVGEA